MCNNQNRNFIVKSRGIARFIDGVYGGHALLYRYVLTMKKTNNNKSLSGGEHVVVPVRKLNNQFTFLNSFLNAKAMLRHTQWVYDIVHIKRRISIFSISYM